MLTNTANPKELWESLCDISARENPFSNLEDVKRYLETVVAKEGINCFDVPPFDTLSISELSEILWKYQLDSAQR
jgi:hypothetical protein|tara:strand:- start:6151 stop:6375 length:225 start_codon:yes stop_codon:yes gene_type:complete